jgi:hypothetical protein
MVSDSTEWWAFFPFELEVGLTKQRQFVESGFGEELSARHDVLHVSR